MSENDESLPRLLGGRYRLEAKLGSGGMGVVYRAADLTMHRPVAVKLIRGVDGVALDEEVAGRFLREAKNTARVQHENIIEVFDLGRSDAGDMYFVMELLEGESLSAKLRREGKLAPPLAVHIARQMCSALHVAHAAGIIHRDLKPANVMLVHRGPDTNYVKVLDFGVAKSYTPDQQTQLTHTGMLVGTVEYMAPEQIMGRTVDGRTDIYALGVLMYRMLSGKAPFRDGGVPALIHAHLNVYPKPITETTPEVPGEIDRIVLRCLAKQPEQRFESMEEVSRALAGALAPPDVVLARLEYSPDVDPYDASDATEVARPPRVEPPRPARAAPPPTARMGPQAAPRVEPPSPSRGEPPAQVRIPAPPPPRMSPPTPAPARVEPPPTPAPARVEPPPPPAPARVEPPPPREEIAQFEDATVKMDRPERDSGARPRPPAPDASVERTAVMQIEDITTSRRQIPDEVTRIDSSAPRECAMCRTLNAPHARACSACGVSLAAEDQEAVRARVTAPRTAHLAAPHLPPPTSGAYPAPQGPFAHSPPQGVASLQGMQGMPGGHGQQAPHQGMYGGGPPVVQSGAWGAPNARAPEASSAWQRFLAWTGLRGR